MFPRGPRLNSAGQGEVDHIFHVPLGNPPPEALDRAPVGIPKAPLPSPETGLDEGRDLIP